MSALGIIAGVGAAATAIERLLPSSSHESPALDRAERPTDFMSALLQQLDSDGDGVLRLEESGLDAERFAQFDINGDGVLDRGEIAAGIRGFMAARQREAAARESFGTLDANHDARLTPSEAGLHATAFTKVDADHDGAIQFSEFKKHGNVG